MGAFRLSCRVLALAALGVLWAGCPRGAEPTAPADEPAGEPSATEPGAESAAAEPDRLPRFRLSIVGINDLHGHVERLPVYAGYVANLRSAGYKTVVVDAGDMFQGTLASNLGEGDAVVAAYNEMGVAAAAIGNHEFDFGPVGPAATVSDPRLDAGEGEPDPQGALKARAAQASFPFLASNIVDAATGELIAWEGVSSSVIVERGMIKVGILGATTMGTPNSTLAPNFAGLRMTPLAEALEREARSLRERGAHVVVAAVHAGASCTAFDNPDDLSSCDLDDELTSAVRSLPEGLIDVVVAGHTHQAMAHRVNGTAIIQQYAYGRALGRVDLHLQQRTLDVADVVIHPPRDLCAGRGEPCKAGSYEDAPVVADERIAALLEPFVERGNKLEARPLGLVLAGPVERSYDRESALGNLFSDALLARTPGADVALSNGGGLRADLPAGPLLYGSLYEAMPFDNRVATFSLTVAELERAFASNLSSRGGVLAVAGIRVEATCRDGALDIELYREIPRDRPAVDAEASGAKKPGAKGRKRRKARKRRAAKAEPLADDERLTVVTNDYLALRGDKILGVVERSEDALTLGDAMVRDEIVAYLEALGRATADSAAAGAQKDGRNASGSALAKADDAGDGPVGASGAADGAPEPATLQPDTLTARPRLVYPGRRPVRCDADESDTGDRKKQRP